MLNIPDDVKAYLSEAACQIAQEQGFKPQDESEMGDWLNANLKPIAERASMIQWSLLNRMEPHKKEVVQILAAKVWGQIRRQQINQAENKMIQQVFND